MTKEKSNLEDLKKNYLQIQKKYDLPIFEELNQDFQIEKLAETETDYLIREIRKFISDKLSNYLRFSEMILHPVNSSMFIFSIIKSMGIEGKIKLNKIYKQLAKIEIGLMKLDINFSEEKEAKFIKDSYTIWCKLKKELLILSQIIESNWDNKTEVNGKNYFG